jgi:hypothetical protein
MRQSQRLCRYGRDQVIAQALTHLAHPDRVRLRGDPGDLNAARRELDDEEHAHPCQATTGPDVDREEVRGGQDVPVDPSGTRSMSSSSRAQARAPDRVRGGWWRSCLAKLGDRGRQRSLDPRGASVAVLRGHAHVSARISATTGGRSGPGRALPSYCLAINARCQANNLSGVTIVAYPVTYVVRVSGFSRRADGADRP